nr:hypothetical protein [Tanacetum cinerariifolium]
GGHQAPDARAQRRGCHSGRRRARARHGGAGRHQRRHSGGHRQAPHRPSGDGRRKPGRPGRLLPGLANRATHSPGPVPGAGREAAPGRFRRVHHPFSVRLFGRGRRGFCGLAAGAGGLPAGRAAPAARGCRRQRPGEGPAGYGRLRYSPRPSPVPGGRGGGRWPRRGHHAVRPAGAGRFGGAAHA